MAGIRIEIKGAAEILKKLTVVQRMEPLQKFLTDAALLAQREARANAPQDTRTLARSIALEVKPLHARVFTTLAYAPVMEYGRRPGAKMPPPAALEGWARRHGFSGSLFVLARAIGRRGIKGRFFMKKARDKVEQEIPRLLSDMEKRIKALWG